MGLTDEVIFERNDETIYWRTLSNSDQDEVERLYKECFFKREPICQMLSKTYTAAEDIMKFDCSMALTSLKQNYSIGAYDVKHKDELCAYAIVSHNQPSTETHDYATFIEEGKTAGDSAIAQLYRYLKIFDEDLRKHIDLSDYLMVEMVVVEDGYLNRGIMSRLLERLALNTKETNIRYITTLAASNYVQRINVKLGCKELKEVKYKEYVDKVTGKMPFKNPPSPHTSCKLMCLDLDEH